jgi:hypothetical protein
LVAAYSSFAALEATPASGATANDTVVVTLTVNTTISINHPADVALPAITGAQISNNNALQWLVVTNNGAGYIFELSASTSPAMKCSSGGCTVNTDNFADYTPAAADVPETWSVAAAASEFGYTASGTDASTTFTNGTKYINTATTYKNIGGRATVTPVAGVSTTVTFQAEVGATSAQPGGNYTATTTARVTTL